MGRERGARGGDRRGQGQRESKNKKVKSWSPPPPPPRFRKCKESSSKAPVTYTGTPSALNHHHHRPSALQTLTKEVKKRSRSSSSASPSGYLPPTTSPNRKSMRLQNNPNQIVGPAVADLGGGYGGGRELRSRSSGMVCSLDMPSLSPHHHHQSTFPVIKQPKTEQIRFVEPSLPPPSPFMNQAPYYSPNSFQSRQDAYHHHGRDLVIPVPLPRQRDVVLISTSLSNLSCCDLLSPFQNGPAVTASSSLFLPKRMPVDKIRRVPRVPRAVKAPQVSKAPQVPMAPQVSMAPQVPTAPEVPMAPLVYMATQVSMAHQVPTAPQSQESIYQEMISQHEEKAERDQSRLMAEMTALRLKNLLKLSKAHKWVIYEWFYSDIDRVLFEGETDFEACLRESFPKLKVRQMRRAEWVKIREKMGKPRRCSEKFLDEERKQLAKSREKIRMIQRRNKVITDWGNMRYLPDEIPMMLRIGTSVSARVRTPLDGIYQGTVEGVDISNNTYRIYFGRIGLGTYSIPDFEVRATTTPETISSASYFVKVPRHGGDFENALKFKFRNAALLQEKMEGELPQFQFPIDSMLGGFPLRCLELIVRKSKLLKAKKSKLGELSELNVEAEKMTSYGRPYPDEYRRRYATCIVQLKEINEGLEKVMRVIKVYMEEIADDGIQGVSTGPGQDLGGSSSSGKMVYPDKVKEKADKEANGIVSVHNFPDKVTSPKILDMIRNMTSVMLQVKALGTKDGDRTPVELQSLRETLGKMKESLEGNNLKAFQNKVDIPLKRIMAGLCVDPMVVDDKKT